MMGFVVVGRSPSPSVQSRSGWTQYFVWWHLQMPTLLINIGLITVDGLFVNSLVIVDSLFLLTCPIILDGTYSCGQSFIHLILATGPDGCICFRLVILSTPLDAAV